MIAFADGYESSQYQWFKIAFQHLFDRSDAEVEELAVYVPREPHTAVVYLTPRASGRIAAAMPLYVLEDCQRPATEDVALLIGTEFASSTDWCELDEEQRARRIALAGDDAHHEAMTLGLLPVTDEERAAYFAAGLD
ncbi:MAG: hypothetical protein ABIQ30_04400 [Devosia sp.]